jgi:uncharacterized membrane protein YheB (UPF0754 family)
MLLVSVVVAAFIGGITNHLAIKMLFFPYEAKRLFGVRVPFTPGIIPKRRAEIAHSFGEIVSNHLVTSDGLRSYFRSQSFTHQINQAIERLIHDLRSQDQTLADSLARILPEGQWQQMKEHLAEWLRTQASGLLDQWLEQLKQRTIAELIGGFPLEQRQKIAEQVVDYGFSHLESALYSERGERWLRNMVEQLIQKMTGGGFFGGMIGSFLDAQSLTEKLRTALVDKLKDGELQGLAGHWLTSKVEEWSNRELGQWLAAISEANVSERFKSQLLGAIDWQQPLEQLLQVRTANVIERLFPNISQTLANLLDRHAGTILESLHLSNLVREQIAKFPIEQIERMILDVSGREFRAITWLGVLLGGIIGLVQFLLMNLWN